ncbi:MAG: hypothetical protein ACR2HF_02515 [Methylococcaceae bacterium]
MASIYLINAAPLVQQLGTRDLSTVQVPREPEQYAQHLPKCFLFAQKGPLTPQLVSGAEAELMYGTQTFDLRSKFANHQTVFSKLMFAEGNNIMVQRVMADDVGPEANVLLSLDVLPTKVDLYQRDPTGAIQLDTTGAPIKVGSADGYKVMWVTSHITTVAGIAHFGQAAVSAGAQTDSVSGTQSQRFPIFEFKASFLGEAGNNSGLRFWAPTQDTESNMPTTLMSKERVYPYYVSMIRRSDATSSPKVVQTQMGDQYVSVVLKEGVIDPISDREMFMGDILLGNYQNVSDPAYPKVFGDFGTMAIYQENLDQLVAQFLEAESTYIDSFSDFSADPKDAHLFNIVSGVSSQNVPYHSFQLIDGSGSVRLTSFSNIFAGGGSDGSLDNVTFNRLVRDQMEAYLDPNSEMQELALNVESIIYDTGFELQTKYALADMIALRKDTCVVLSTYDIDGPVMTQAEEHSVAVALRTRLQMFPESDYFGTPVMRGLIVGRSGILRNSQYKGRLPLTFEVGIKAARYMGAGNGRWKNGYNFDGAPGSLVENMTDISITWVPTSVRNKNWSVGLNWVQAFDRKSFFFPALKTVYANDTSVLNSFITVLAICTLNKVTAAAWRQFSGVSGISNGQLIDRTNAFIKSQTQGRFDDRFTIEPAAFFTDTDILNGFSWTVPVKIYAQNMKTVMTSYIEAYRAKGA